MYEFHIFPYFTVCIAYLIMISIDYVQGSLTVLFLTPQLLVNEIAVRVMSTLASYLSFLFACLSFMQSKQSISSGQESPLSRRRARLKNLRRYK